MGMHIEYAERKHGRKPVTYPHADLGGDPGGHLRGASCTRSRSCRSPCAWPATRWARPTRSARPWARRSASSCRRTARSFVEGAKERGYEGRKAEEIFELIVPFADYGFNASHACAYALRRLPDRVPQGASPRRVHVGGPDQREGRQGPQALLPQRVPPDGSRGPAAGRQRVRARLRAGPRRASGGSDTACRRSATSAPASSARSIDARAREGNFASFADFCRKVDPGVLTKKVLE